MSLETMRVGIDVRYLSHRLVGGVHTYVSRLIPELLRVADGTTFVLYADAKAPLELAPPVGVEVRVLPWHHPLSSIWNDERLGALMARDNVDVGFFPTNHGLRPAGAAAVVTVHDAINLLPLRHTLLERGHRVTIRSAATTVYLHQATVRAVRRATRLVTMSSYSRDTIVAASRRRPEDISVVHHGAPPLVALPEDAGVRVAREYGLATRYLLADGLKNPAVVLRAAARLTPALRQSVALVFFARHADVLPVLREAVARGDARLLVRPSTETLAALYAGAAAFVFPSWVEGFGIPLLEAMSYGAPIVASDRGSIPEVAGDAALLVDAEDDAGLAAALTTVLSDTTAAARLRALGRARVAQFTWRRSAEQTMVALRTAQSVTAAGRS